MFKIKDRQTIYRSFLALFLSFVFVVPIVVFADTSSTVPEIQNFPTAELAGLNKTGISGDGTEQIQLFVGRSIAYLLGFLGTLALCIIIYSGLRFMLSQGDADKRNGSLKMMLWAGIGVVALLGSYSLVRFVFGVL